MKHHLMDKKLCKHCQHRKALYYSHVKRRWRWNSHHTLCSQCYRSVRASERASLLVSGEDATKAPKEMYRLACYTSLSHILGETSSVQKV